MENAPSTPQPLPREFYLHVAAGILFSVITCGLHNIYWNYRQFQALNILLGREQYKFLQWLLLSIVTCGIYHIYYEYRMGVDLHGYLKEQGRPVSDNLALIGLLLSCFGLTILADAVYQHELNKLCE